MSCAQVIYNRDLFTHIVSYLSVEELKVVAEKFRGLLHYDYIVPTKHTLVYGEVQSGKTGKIMDYIQRYMPQLPKLLILQNNVFMQNQYVRALKSRQISYTVIHGQTKTREYRQEQVIVLINNKYRKNALLEYLAKNKYSLKQFCLILDESDQYLHSIRRNPIFTTAKHVLHVTATPFHYKKFPLDDMVMLKPRNNYVGLKEVVFREIMISNTHYENYVVDMHACMYNIIGQQFTSVPDGKGIMMITCFNKIVTMKEQASILSRRHPSMPVIVVTMNIFVYVNGVIDMTIKKKNIQKLFDMFDHKNIIVIANRLSNRGINYTNSTYTRHITHQISVASNNYTSFIQKCRIFGVRESNEPRPVLYCIKSTTDGYYDKLINRLDTVSKIKQQPDKIKNTVRMLKQMCKERGIKGYSKLRKGELIALLQDELDER